MRGREAEAVRRTRVRPGEGTRVADTPGLEIFALWEVAPEDLKEHFPEFAAPAASCKFRDCAHLTEPGCGVRKAVETGRIAPSRHENYARMRRVLIERKELFG